MVRLSLASRSPSKFLNLRMNLIPPSKFQSCKLSILLAKFHLWLSIIIILFVSSSFSTISNSEHQAELGSRTRLRARAVADQQIYPTSVNNQLRARCQGATCKSTKPPLSTRFVEDSAKPNDNRAIHHQAKISTRNVKSSRSVKARDCTLLGPKKDPPVPETDKQAKEKPADPKKQSEAKSLTQTNDQSILKNNPSPTETTKSDFARRPFPYEKYHPDLKFIPMSFPIVRSTLQPATPASNPAPSKPRTQTKQILPPAKPLGQAADPPSPAPTSQPKPLSRVSAGSRNSNKPKNSNSSSKWLSAHNDIRAKYSAKPLTWSSKLEATAQAWADRCVFEHSKGGGYGEPVNRRSNLWFKIGCTAKMNAALTTPGRPFIRILLRSFGKVPLKLDVRPVNVQTSRRSRCRMRFFGSVNIVHRAMCSENLAETSGRVLDNVSNDATSHLGLDDSTLLRSTFKLGFL